MRIQAENRAYRIGEVMALSDTAYYAYRRELQNRPRQKGTEGSRREAAPSCWPWARTVRMACR